MWKESYRIGIEAIDEQHKKLFQMTNELLNAIEEKQGPEEFQRVVDFLKDYVVIHFRDEEAYQASIQYAGMPEHVLQHKRFTDTILAFEERLKKSGYDLEIVKELAGMLTSWLIYHVADADQKIVGRETKPAEDKEDSHIDCFVDGVRNVLEQMAGENYGKIGTKKSVLKQDKEDVAIKVDFVGDLPGSAVFVFSREFALKIFEVMTFMTPREVDSMVCSALAEISNIVSGTAAMLLSRKGVQCDIKTPVLSAGKATEEEKEHAVLEGIHISTGLGSIEVGLTLPATA